MFTGHLKTSGSSKAAIAIGFATDYVFWQEMGKDIR